MWGAVDVSGGVPGNFGVLATVSDGVDRPAAVMNMDADGRARIPFVVESMPENLEFYVYSVDRKGNVIRSALTRPAR